MNIAVIGTGYVGLVTGTCLAETGNNVVCVDIDENKVNLLNNKIPTIYEKGLEVLLKRNVDEKRLSFTVELEKSVRENDIIFLALPTPDDNTGKADLKYVVSVANEIGNYIDRYKIVINKSTVPVGTAELVRNCISKNTNSDFDVVSNPEFLKEGVAIDDFLKPERIIIGTQSQRAKEVLEKLYKPYVRQGNPIIFMDEKSAELTKYAANSYLATKITFMNEIARLCELVEADVDMVRLGIGSDSRIGKRFLFPGLGYGGSCFPKDVKALVEISKENAYDFKILQSVNEVNEHLVDRFFNKVKRYFKGDLSGLCFAVWGLSFKPNTDDIREAPALKLIDRLLNSNAKIVCYDPVAMDNVREVYGDSLDYANNAYDCVQDADALLITTEWSMFRNTDFKRLKQLMNEPIIFDGRNLYDLDEVKQARFTYLSVGRKEVL